MQASCQKIHDDELPISKNENFDQNNFKHIYNIGINFFVLAWHGVVPQSWDETVLPHRLRSPSLPLRSTNYNFIVI